MDNAEAAKRCNGGPEKPAAEKSGAAGRCAQGRAHAGIGGQQRANIPQVARIGRKRQCSGLKPTAKTVGASPQHTYRAHGPASPRGILDGKPLPCARKRTQTDSSGFCVGAATRLAEKQRITVPLWQTDVNRREDARLLPVWPCS